VTEETIKQAEQVLIKQDPALGKLIKKQRLAPLEPRTDYFHSLARSVIGQQISVAAARAIFTRFEAATELKPAQYLKLSEEDIKTIGLSKQKSNYIGDLARHFVNDPKVYNHLEKQPDEAIISELTEIKGIGKWTAQMFLMFTLGRPDVFAPDDVGLQRAIIKLYNLEALPPKAELEALANKWQPYRTIASLHLWHSLDNNPA
jgi:DNA-3-methyladenine glycosylase II